MRRLAKKGRAFDAVVLDPPTFSQSKESGPWQAEKNYGQLVEAALPLLKRDGVLFASTNAAKMEPEKFLSVIREAIGKSRPENSSTTLRAATAGFSHHARRAGVFENGLAANLVMLEGRVPI